MQLKADSRIVRWAYWMEIQGHRGVPARTSLCAIFWRAVFGAPLVAFGMACLVAVLSPLLAVWWLSEKWYERTGHYPLRRLTDRVADSVLIQGARSVKSKVCPIVEIVQ